MIYEKCYIVFDLALIRVPKLTHINTWMQEYFTFFPTIYSRVELARWKSVELSHALWGVRYANCKQKPAWWTDFYAGNPYNKELIWTLNIGVVSLCMLGSILLCKSMEGELNWLLHFIKFYNWISWIRVQRPVASISFSHNSLQVGQSAQSRSVDYMVV